jgi:putative oxidoreductase
MDAGLLVGRIVLGLLMAAHGAQKLFGWFGGYGLTAVSGFFESLGFRPGRFFAATAASAEVASGLLVAFGLLGPVGPALIVSVMIVAAVTVHWGSGVIGEKSMELPILYAAGAATLALTGPGRYSLDALVGLDGVWTPERAWIALAMGVIGGVVNLALRRTAPRVATA